MIFTTKNTFTIESANELLNLIKAITVRHSKEFNNCINVNNMEGAADTIESWKIKIEKLGVHPKGKWLCDFDNGNGYFCWKYPEETVSHAHAYNEGFTSRRKV